MAGACQPLLRHAWQAAARLLLTLQHWCQPQQLQVAQMLRPCPGWPPALAGWLGPALCLQMVANGWCTHSEQVEQATTVAQCLST